MRAEGARAGGGPRRVLHHRSRRRKGPASTTRCARSARSRRLLAPLIGDGQADPAREYARRRAASAPARTCTPAQAIVFLQDWDERDETTAEIVDALRERARARSRRARVPRSAAASSRGTAGRCRSCSAGPTTRSSPAGATAMLARMAENPGSSTRIRTTRRRGRRCGSTSTSSRAADLGVSTEEIGTTLETMMGSRRVTTFVEDGEEYDVVAAGARRGPRRAGRSREHLRALGPQRRAGAAVLAGDADRDRGARHAQPLQPAARHHASSASLAPRLHARRGDRLDAGRPRPRSCRDVRTDRLQGRSRASTRRPAARCSFTFAMALLIVYLVLAAQFESFIHPLVIMLTVPLAVTRRAARARGHRAARSTSSARSASSCWSASPPRTAS